MKSGHNGESIASANLNAFSVDVEDYFHVSAFESDISPNDWGNLQSRVASNTDRLIDILGGQGIIATFFVLGWVAERHANLVKRISAAGHEVACHGYSHQKIYNQSRNSFREETRRAKSILEDITGNVVHGYRAASFSITSESLWALDVLAESGFAYDSSVYPVFHDNYGLPEADAAPSILTTPNGQKIVEFPLSCAKFAGISVPVGGGGYFRLYPYWLTESLLNRVVRQGRPINFYCHPWEVDTGQPRICSSSWRSKFRHYNNIERVEMRLDRLFGDFAFTTCANVLSEYGLLATDPTQSVSGD